MVDDTREAMRRAALDQEGQAARRALCTTLAEALWTSGERLRVAGLVVGSQRKDGTSPFGNGDDRVMALGYLAQSASTLISGTATLASVGNRYGAAALNRQLVEVEYLAWAFAEDREEAGLWLRSTGDERRRMWQPKHLRRRSAGRFDEADYWGHCEIGGHPTPPGLRHLLGGDAVVSTEYVFYEAAHHGRNVWAWLEVAADATPCGASVAPVERDAVARAVGAWSGVDWLPTTRPDDTSR